MTTGKIKISEYVAFIASGSDISNPDAKDGYQPALARELHRVGPKGGTITVDAEGAADLAEWAHDLSIAVAQEPNPSGARSLYGLSERARTVAHQLKGRA